MRAVFIFAAVAIVAAIAWFAIGGQESEPVVSQPTASETPASDETSEATDDATDAVEDAVEQVQDALNDAAEEAETAVNEAVDSAAEQINDAVSDVLGSGEETALASGNVEVETEAAGDSGNALSTALTVDGFDADMLKAEVAGSSMSPVQRLAAKVMIEQAEADPGKIESVVNELRKALYVE